MTTATSSEPGARPPDGDATRLAPPDAPAPWETPQHGPLGAPPAPGQGTPYGTTSGAPPHPSTTAPGYPPQGYPPPSTAPPGYPPPSTAPPGYPPSGYQPPGYPPAGGGYGPPAIPGVPPLPEGVTLAPVGRRIGAYFLSIVLVIVTLVIGYIIWGLIVWRRGTSPALSVLKMRCVKVDGGAKATFGTMALRNIIGGIVEGILGWITMLVSLILFLTRADHRCLHDLVGGTVVVHDPGGRLDA